VSLSAAFISGRERRAVLFFLLLVLLIGESRGNDSARAATRNSEARQNVLLIVIDTLRADKLGCYGSQRVRTPNIDRLAKRGVLFTRAFAHNPLTLPSHANIMTGMTPPYHGVHDNENFNLRDQFLTLAEYLKAQGYSTGAVVGACPLDSRFGIAQGFDFYEDNVAPKGSPRNSIGERSASAVAALAENWLSWQKPGWFFWMHVFDPHYPYEPPEPFLSQYPEKPYNGEVAYVDSVLGEFFKYLEENGHLEQTLIILTSDHGESLGDHGEKTHGMLAYNSTLWVPLIVSFPGLKPARIEQRAAHIDIFPTVCDLLGLEKPAVLQGVSLVPAMKGKKIPSRQIYFESLEPYYNFGWAPLRGFLSGKQKFLDCPIPELYDLEVDFEETVNLAENNPVSAFRSQLGQLLKTLSHPDADGAEKRYGQETREMLRSLGYAGRSGFEKKTKFGPQDDIKRLLPIYNKVHSAYILKDSGETDKGIAELRKTIAAGAKIYQAYLYLAQLLREKGLHQDSLEVLEEGIRRFPANYEILRLYSRCLLDAGRYAEVVELVRSRSLFQMEQDPRIWYFLGQAETNLNDYPAAVDAFERAVDADPEFAQAYLELGQAYLSFSEHEEEEEALYQKSIAALKRALKIDPGLTAAYRVLGLAYFHSGDMDEAILNLEASLSQGLADGRLHYALGRAYLSKGNKSKALASFTACKSKYIDALSEEEKNYLDILITRSQPRKK
jgi:arylsulfatase A-like enzyme/Tfp pilus assembly protein PilF